MKALTLWPEWAYAITHLGKDCENRDWRYLPKKMEGQLLLIHAGKLIGGGKVAKAAALKAVEDTIPTSLGARPELNDDEIPTGAVVAIVRISEVKYDHESPWANPESWQMVFSEVYPLPIPIPCRGKQGLWNIGIKEIDAVLKQCPLF